MTSINYVRGDATSPAGTGPRIIAHIVNDVGAWGRGFVVSLSRKWALPERCYREWSRYGINEEFGLGAVQTVAVDVDLFVMNMVGQAGIGKGTRSGPPIQYDAVRTCLQALAKEASRLGASVHMPRIGCGLAGGDWAVIEPLIQDALCKLDIPVTVYLL